MPGRNINKVYAPYTYYHVYNRGVNKQTVFKVDRDYQVFLNLLKRYAGPEIAKNSYGRQYPNYHRDIEILSYCLMANHFHIQLYVNGQPESMEQFMRSVTTAYVMYFNKKYKRVGPLFQQRYRAVLVQDEAQLWHLSRYIHLNPSLIGHDFKDYPYSSFQYFMGSKHVTWVRPEKILALFNGNSGDYKQFVSEYLPKSAELKLSEAELF